MKFKSYFARPDRFRLEIEFHPSPNMSVYDVESYTLVANGESVQLKSRWRASTHHLESAEAGVDRLFMGSGIVSVPSLLLGAWPILGSKEIKAVDIQKDSAGPYHVLSVTTQHGPVKLWISLNDYLVRKISAPGLETTHRLINTEKQIPEPMFEIVEP